MSRFDAVWNQICESGVSYNSLINDLLHGLDATTQHEMLEFSLSEETKKALTTADLRKKECSQILAKELAWYCASSSLAQPSLLTHIFQARKKASMDAEQDATLLAFFIYEQLQFLRQVHNPIVDQVKSKKGKAPVLRAITRTDMKIYADHMMSQIGIAPENKVVVYRELNRLIRSQDVAINDERTILSQARAGFDASEANNYAALKNTLLSGDPDEKIIADNVSALAHHSIAKGMSTKDKIDTTVQNLSKVLLELHDEPFMKGNGFARAKVYNQVVELLLALDAQAIEDDVGEQRKWLGKGWFHKPGERFSLWCGYYKYSRSRIWHKSYFSAIVLLKEQTEKDVSNDHQYKHLAPALQEIIYGLEGARLVNKRNRQLNTLRPTLLALGSMTSLGFAISALLGFTTVALFGFALFSNPFVLPSILLAFAIFSTVRALYHIAHKPKQEIDREINTEHESKIYHNFDDNPNTGTENSWQLISPKTWPVRSWMKSLVNYLPIICALVAVGLVLNFFVPGIFDFTSSLNLKDLLTPNVGESRGGWNAYFERMFAAMLPVMAFGTMGMLGGKILKWGYFHNSKAAVFIGNDLQKSGIHDSKAAIFIGNVLQKSGSKLFILSSAIMALEFVKLLPIIPTPIVTFAVSLTAAIVLVVWYTCAQLYTNFIDARASQKAASAENLAIAPGLYTLPKPTAYSGFEKSSQETNSKKMMTKAYGMLMRQEEPPEKPVENINKYYKATATRT